MISIEKREDVLNAYRVIDSRGDRYQVLGQVVTSSDSEPPTFMPAPGAMVLRLEQLDAIVEKIRGIWLAFRTSVGYTPFQIGEDHRQAILIAIANLAHERPGWTSMLGDLAHVLRGREMFDDFLELAKYGPLAGVGALDAKQSSAVAGYHLGAIASALRAEGPEIDPLLEATARLVKNDRQAQRRILSLLNPDIVPEAAETIAEDLRRVARSITKAGPEMSVDDMVGVLFEHAETLDGKGPTTQPEPNDGRMLTQPSPPTADERT
jgi:hypothetical protein